MDARRLKRDLIALLIIAPVIVIISQIFSWVGIDSPIFWSTNSSHEQVVRAGNKLHLVTDLSGEWHFASGDDAARSDEHFEHGDWAKVQVPSYWESEGYNNYDGYGWYRKYFELGDDQIDQSLFLLLGMVDDVDEVFVNGIKIGGTGKFPPSYTGAWNQERKYDLPSDVIRPGINVVAVRVYDAHQGGGIYKGDIGIYASDLPTALVNLEGQWQFKVAEDMDYENIQVPGIWENQGYQDFNGIAWYRKNFGEVKAGENEQLVLLLGKVDDTDEVYINGQFVGRTGNLTASDLKTDSKYYQIKRQYEFSSSILDTENTIEVRVFDGTGHGGIYEGPVAIISKQAYLAYTERQARSQ